MKRLNPNTGKIFEYGDARSEDDLLFFGYIISEIKPDGFFAELWAHASKSKTKESINARNAKRRAAKMQRTPPWLSESQIAEIQNFYMQAQMLQNNTGNVYHVDHIVPLQGDIVSGLHVPWNLQVLPAKENIEKGNKHG